eukprot:3445754-Rhodomonas_salina.1
MSMLRRCARAGMPVCCSRHTGAHIAHCAAHLTRFGGRQAAELEALAEEEEEESEEESVADTATEGSAARSAYAPATRCPRAQRACQPYDRSALLQLSALALRICGLWARLAVFLSDALPMSTHGRCRSLNRRRRCAVDVDPIGLRGRSQRHLTLIWRWMPIHAAPDTPICVGSGPRPGGSNMSLPSMLRACGESSPSTPGNTAALPLAHSLASF